MLTTAILYKSRSLFFNFTMIYFTAVNYNLSYSPATSLILLCCIASDQEMQICVFLLDIRVFSLLFSYNFQCRIKI